MHAQRNCRLRLATAASLVSLLLSTLLPTSLMAQPASNRSFLPLVSQGQTAQQEGEGEAPLLAQGDRLLPQPVALAAAPGSQLPGSDADADGVPDSADSCPFQPNPPLDGVQPDFCGPGLRAIIGSHVFLRSRIFPHTAGLDPALAQTQARPRIHALLHVVPNDNGVVLLPQQRAQLEEQDVHLLGYLPHNTYYVSLPRDPARWQQIVALGNVYGLTALQPADKVAPQVRVRGATLSAGWSAVRP